MNSKTSAQIISIVPLELFTSENMKEAKKRLLACELLSKNGSDNKHCEMRKDLGERIKKYMGNAAEVQDDHKEKSSNHLEKESILVLEKLQKHKKVQDAYGFLVFKNTSVIFIYISHYKLKNLSASEICEFREIQKYQNELLHSTKKESKESPLQCCEESPLQKYFTAIKEACTKGSPDRAERKNPKPLDELIEATYAFSFCYFPHKLKKKIITQIMEPDSSQATCFKLEDYDTSKNSKIYINWSTILIIQEAPNSDPNSQTLEMVIALEVALQISWNRCHAMGNLIPEIVADNLTAYNEEKLYNSFLAATDEAECLQSPMTSAREIKIFDAMFETSRIGLQSNRLKTRLKMLTQKDTHEENELDNKYQGAIQNTLLFFGGFSVLQAIFVVLDLAYTWWQIVVLYIIPGVIFVILILQVLHLSLLSKKRYRGHKF